MSGHQPIAPTRHALLGPSSQDRWTICAGSVRLSIGRTDTPKIYTAWGTVGHEVAAMCLTFKGAGAEPSYYLGKKFEADGFEIEVDQEMVDCVKKYVDSIRHYSNGAELFVEQALEIEYITGEKGAIGTGDVVIIDRFLGEVQSHDLKTGEGVEVSAKENGQLLMYGHAAYRKLIESGQLVEGEIDTLRLVIHQPRLKSTPDEWVISLAEAERRIEGIRQAARKIIDPVTQVLKEDAPLVAHPDACMWCKAKPICPKLEEEILNDFEEMPEAMLPSEDGARIAALIPKLDMIQSWCKAILAEGERRLYAGMPLPGYKLVNGKRGARGWTDPTAVEAMLRQKALDAEEIYESSLRSPAKLEKVVADKRPDLWEELQGFITQASGKPAVVPESDKRPAIVITPVADDFQVVEHKGTGVEDLF